MSGEAAQIKIDSDDAGGCISEAADEIYVGSVKVTAENYFKDSTLDVIPEVPDEDNLELGVKVKSIQFRSKGNDVEADEFQHSDTNRTYAYPCRTDSRPFGMLGLSSIVPGTGDASTGIGNSSSVHVEDVLVKLIETGFQSALVDYAGQVYDPETFRRNFAVQTIIGDGSCFYRAVLSGIGVSESETQPFREAIADWFIKYSHLMFERFALTETQMLVRSEAIRENEWGDEYEMYAFEQMSGIRIIVYSEETRLDKRKRSEITRYACTRGLGDESTGLNPFRLALLYRGRNHYDLIIRDTSWLNSMVTDFRIKFMPIERGVDDLDTRKWPQIEDNNLIKKKQAPAEFLSLTEYENWKCYELEPINGLSNYSYVRAGTWISAFYQIDAKNEDLKDKKANFTNHLHKGVDVVKFEDTIGSSHNKKSVDKLGIAKTVEDLPVNLHFGINLEGSTFAKRFPMPVVLREAVPHAVCYTCSGRNSRGDAMYRYFKNLNKLIEHSGRGHGGIQAHSFCNLELSNDTWIVVQSSSKPLTNHLMLRETVQGIVSKPKRVTNAKSSPKPINPGGHSYVVPLPQAQKSEPLDACFRIYGWNARSAVKAENVYHISKFLTEEDPDFLLINDSGKYNDRVCKTVKKFKAFYSGDSLLAFYKNEISVTPIWEESWDQLFMILKITLNKKSMLLVNAYRRPGDAEAAKRLVATIALLDDRYVSTPVVVFGDMNFRREELREKFRSLFERSFRFIFDDDPEQYTRSQKTVNGIQRSYLDYFLVKNVFDFDFHILEPIGNSDHRCLRMDIVQNNMRIMRRQIREFKFSLVKKNSEQIGKRLLDSLSNPMPVHSCSSLVEELRIEFPRQTVKLRSHFKVIEKLRNQKNWEAIRNIITRSNEESYAQFMACFDKLRVSRRDKEFYARLRFYSDLNRDVSILSNLLIACAEFGQSVTTDRDAINKAVTEKYRKQFKDEGTKLMLTPLDDQLVLYTPDMVRCALFSLNLSKATSWDLIPGEAFAIFKEERNLPHLVNFINRLICEENTPDILCLGRLMCLNKNSLEPGNLDSLRPIVILGVIIKICEHPLLKVLKKIILNKGQIGFKEGMGCEVNIIRLRQLAHDVQYDGYDRKSKMEKRYILFIDLKTAFDSVNLVKLIAKLRIKGLPVPVINTLIKLMNCSKISADMVDVISINVGVAQGKLCSPLLFNIYFDDLLDELNKICYASLAFADDLVIICKNRAELTAAVRALHKWSEENEILANEKKSGIFIMNDDGTDPSQILGFPVVDNYKYLGVKLNPKLSPKPHIVALNSKLKVYFKKNFMLHKKYFTPMSLVRIVDYFVKSRLSYGLCCFLDCPSSMSEIELTLARHLKNIFGLPINTSHRRLLVTLGEPDLNVRLALRLLKNWHKYNKQYGQYPTIFEATLLNYFDKADLYPDENGLKDLHTRFFSLKADMFAKNIGDKASGFMSSKIRTDHGDYIKKYIFNFPDLRNFYIIRYLTHTTKGTNVRLFPICHCGEKNSPSHGANECSEKLKNRSSYMKLFDDIFARNNLERKDNLYDYLLAIFYTIGTGVLSKDKKTLFESLRKIVFALVRDDESTCSKAEEINIAPGDPGRESKCEFNLVKDSTVVLPKLEDKIIAEDELEDADTEIG